MLAVLSDIRPTTPGPRADGKLSEQNKEDQPGLKETATDCRLLVVAANRLPRTRLGYHLTSSPVDPEREDNGKH